MTIKQVAAKNGVTTQAVYKKIKAAGLKISDITKEKSSELSETGQEIVNQLFINTREKTDKIQPLVDRIKELEKEVETLRARVQELAAERDRWAAVAEAAQQTAQQAQALNMATLQKLPASNEKRSFWARLTGKK